ncbi:glycosyltransferase family 2 protein [Cerasicoccus fimbriatus]|uniref:glycosyltransferase family 2 protein n=1 Tax=Cerasicoccus fimbriatus TaxID=3014554 RepID=UPI0022B39EDA|nr:glycosyltransferase family 2 protein [Cerasicoccus sp. TK19100]
MKPKVSIVIPHFNRSKLLQATLASVEAQSYDHWEVVVVDDGSSEPERTMIQQYASHKVRVLDRTGEPKGPSRSRNCGIQASEGDYVMFLDSDDMLAPWCLENRMRQVSQSPECDFWVFVVMLFREKPADSDDLWNHLQGSDDLGRFLRSDCPWQTTSTLWKRSALERIGGFNDQVFYGDDSDLHTRAIASELQYEKYPSALPDAFIRRSDMERITNSLSPTLIASRRTRLTEGTKFLRRINSPSNRLQDWEGQYFFELEFLLFQPGDYREDVSKVYNEWLRDFSPSPMRRLVVGGYVKLTMMFQTKAYLLVRLARRLAMKFLPAAFFPFAVHSEPAHATAQQMETMRQLLVEAPRP